MKRLLVALVLLLGATADAHYPRAETEDVLVDLNTGNTENGSPWSC